MLLAIHAEKKGAYLVHTLLIASIHATSSIINTTWGQFFFFYVLLTCILKPSMDSIKQYWTQK